MRPERLYLADIIEAADAIGSYVSGLSQSAFLADEPRRAATAFKLIIIGEAAGQLSDALRKRHSGIPWSEIVGLRNIAVHAYHSLDWKIVWTTATQEVPALRQQIARILEAEYPGFGPGSTEPPA